jgi:hypothetical protein
MTDFDSEFEKLALAVAKDAQSAETLADKVDAMKALYQYYALRKKYKPDDGVAEGTMADLARQIELAENGDDGHLASQPWLSGGGQRN